MAYEDEFGLGQFLAKAPAKKKPQKKKELNIQQAFKSGGLTTKPQPTPIQQAILPVGDFVKNNIVQPIIKQAQTTQSVYNAATGIDEQKRQILVNVQEQLKKSRDEGKISDKTYGQLNQKLSGQFGQLNRDIQNSPVMKQDRLETASDVGLTALDVLTLGAGGQAVKQIGKQGAKELGKRTAVEAGKGATLGAGYGLIGSAGTAQNPQELLTGTAVGAGLGGVIGGVSPAISAGVNKLKTVPTRKGLDAQIQVNENTPVSDVAKKQIQDALNEKAKYKQGGVKKATDTLRREVLDPYNRLDREDKAYSKLTKTSQEKLVREGRDLPTLIGNAQHYGEVFNQFVATKGKSGQSLEDIIKKYGETSPEDTQRALNAGTIPKDKQFINYTNNKFALEVLDKSGKNLQKQYDTDAIRKSVAEYEQVNPQAIKDARAFKEFQDNVIDFGVRSKVLNPKDAEYVKKAYKFYTPLSRVTPEDLIKPSIQGGVRTNVGQQRILQNLVGSEKPLDVSFGTALDKAHSDIGQSLKNRFDTELLRRHQEGAFKGDLLVDPELTKAGRELRQLHKNLVGKKETLRGTLNKKSGQLRVENARLAPVNKEAIKATRNYLEKGLDDPGSIAGLKSMTDKQLMDTFRVITGDQEVETIRKQLMKKGEVGQTLVDDIEKLKKEYSLTDEQRQKSFEDLIDVKQDPTRGKQLISGQLNGEKFAIEAEPDFATALEKLSPSETRDLITTGLKAGADAQKTFFTGAFAPVFAVTQAIKNQGIMFTNARRLSPFGARAIAEAFKPDEGFLRELSLRGARPETFTQGVNDAATTAMQIAAKGSVGGKVNLAKNNKVLAGKAFFHSLNKLGAFLGNRQRAQVARGAYQNAINRGIPKDEALNIAAYSYNETIGNFNRVSKLAQNLEPIVLYSGATQSGARSLFRAFRERPIESSAKIAALSSSLGGMAAASLASPAGQEYYKDMYDNKQSYNIDNFITYVAPWASKGEDGKWSGIFKVPIAPDFRPLNKAITEQVYKVGQGEGIDPVIAAQAIFNSATGNILGETSGQTGINLAEPYVNNPIIKGINIIAGKDVQTGKDIPKEDHSGTSDIAKSASKFLGGKLTANQVDKFISQGGLAGQVVKGKKGNPVETVAQNLAGQFYGAQSSNAAVSNQIDDIITSKQTISSDVTDAIKSKDLNKAHRLANDYNKKITSLEQYVKENSKTKTLTDQQKKLIEKMKFPVKGGKLTKSSIDYRRKE